MPFYILGGGGIIGSFAILSMPETADEKLPDTVEEAEEFGRGQKMFPMPILKGRSQKVAPMEAVQMQSFHQLHI